MLRITVQRDVSPLTLKLEGRIAGEWVEELERAWTAECDQGRLINLDLTGVTFVDEEGKKLLSRLFEQGSTLHATDCMNRSIIEQIRRKQLAGNGHRDSQLTRALMVAVIMVWSGMGGTRGQEPALLTRIEAVQTAQSRADLANPVGQIEQLGTK